MHISKYPEILKKAAENNTPNTIANYAYKLAQQFNNYYQKVRIIGIKEEANRIAIVKITKQTLKNALEILEIDAINEM